MAPPSEFREYPVLITGCSSGIGKATVISLKTRGYAVVASARQQQDVDDLIASGQQAVRLDLADKRSIVDGWEQTMALTGGRLYALVNNGAYGQPGAVEDLSDAALREQFEANFFGTHALTLLALPALRQARGRLIQISSILGLVSLRYRGAYSASKYALEALSDALRLELQGSGVRVVLIEPGAIQTRFRANALAAFRRHIHPEHSHYKAEYHATMQRLSRETEIRYSLPAESVAQTVIRTLEHPSPRPRYRVTRSAMLLALFKRWLPDRWMDGVSQRLGA